MTKLRMHQMCLETPMLEHALTMLRSTCWFLRYEELHCNFECHDCEEVTSIAEEYDIEREVLLAYFKLRADYSFDPQFLLTMAIAKADE